jgi:hypothetical protein
MVSSPSVLPSHSSIDRSLLRSGAQRGNVLERTAQQCQSCLFDALEMCLLLYSWRIGSVSPSSMGAAFTIAVLLSVMHHLMVV